MNPRISAAALVATALLIPGCGVEDATRVPVFPAVGSVAREGRPLARVVVRFQPVAPPAGPSKGPEIGSLVTEADEQGRFALSTYLADDGAPAGDYVVTVLPPAGPDSEGRDGPSRRGPVPPALARYGNPATSPLKATIKPGDNRFDFELK